MTTTLVLGGTGKTGSRVAARLRDLGTNVRIGSRTSEVPFDWDDVAGGAVATLTCDGHAGRTYELTGPRLLTFADVAAELTRATGREIGYLPITAAQYADAALAAGVPAEEIEPLSDLFARVL